MAGKEQGSELKSGEKAWVPERHGALHVAALRDPVFGGGSGRGQATKEEVMRSQAVFVHLNLEVCPGQAAGKWVPSSGDKIWVVMAIEATGTKQGAHRRCHIPRPPAFEG